MHKICQLAEDNGHKDFFKMSYQILTDTDRDPQYLEREITATIPDP